MNHLKRYTKSYYQEIHFSSASSAKALVPLINEIIHPNSVVDVGCGTGIWLNEWEKYGVSDYIGLDGDYINKDQLMIPKEKFLHVNLDDGFQLPRKYELVVCLEVAEHIQSAAATKFVGSLCNAGDVILFSAAIPGQGGLNHLNEQYPDYWAKLFEQNGFSPYDYIRQQIWLNENIHACYRQNLLFYVRDEAKQKYPLLIKNGTSLIPIIHPHFYEDKKQEIAALNKILKNPLRIILFYIKGLLRRLRF
ncbi:MAG: class I SAM-dependent methyltransferase [Bacteroidota bacterium]|nr:class I SAM-dependent methyltransferase [Bacteroidota bacterium]